MPSSSQWGNQQAVPTCDFSMQFSSKTTRAGESPGVEHQCPPPRNVVLDVGTPQFQRKTLVHAVFDGVDAHFSMPYLTARHLRIYPDFFLLPAVSSICTDTLIMP